MTKPKIDWSGAQEWLGAWLTVHGKATTDEAFRALWCHLVATESVLRWRLEDAGRGAVKKMLDRLAKLGIAPTQENADRPTMVGDVMMDGASKHCFLVLDVRAEGCLTIVYKWDQPELVKTEGMHRVASGRTLASALTICAISRRVLAQDGLGEAHMSNYEYKRFELKQEEWCVWFTIEVGQKGDERTMAHVFCRTKRWGAIEESGRISATPRGSRRDRSMSVDEWLTAGVSL